MKKFVMPKRQTMKCDRQEMLCQQLRPQSGLNMGMDVRGGGTPPTPQPPSGPMQTFSLSDLVTFVGDPIVTF